MKEINTKYYGTKQLLACVKVKGVKDLFLAQIPSSVEGNDRLLGILDSDNNEVVPFGELRDFEGTRVVNKNVVVVDYISYYGVDDVNEDVHGSILLNRGENGFEPLYFSDAARIVVSGNVIVGANFEDEPNWVDHRMVSINLTEYRYDENGAKIYRLMHFREGEFENGNFQKFYKSECEYQMRLAPRQQK